MSFESEECPCAVLFPSYSHGHPKDTEGCRLPIGHDGPHEFVSTSGRVFEWENDWSCDCDECSSEDGDQCYVYWEKSKTTSK